MAWWSCPMIRLDEQSVSKGKFAWKIMSGVKAEVTDRWNGTRQMNRTVGIDVKMPHKINNYAS
jgi:hypothetical protein